MAPPAPARSAYLTTAAFGQHLGLAPEWVRASILAGELAAINEGGRYRIPRQAVGAYLKRRAWWRGSWP
jgi:excisionase family DNA binding protein